MLINSIDDLNDRG